MPRAALKREINGLPATPDGPALAFRNLLVDLSGTGIPGGIREYIGHRVTERSIEAYIYERVRSGLRVARSFITWEIVHPSLSELRKATPGGDKAHVYTGANCPVPRYNVQSMVYT